MAGMHLLMPSLTLLMHMLTPMAPMGTDLTVCNDVELATYLTSELASI